MSQYDDTPGDDERKIFTEAFHKFDVNGDGELILSEFAQACEEVGCKYDEETLQTMFKAMDTDKNGMVTLEEFLNFMGPDLEEKTEASIRRLFQEYDIDNDGLLTADEIQKAWFSGDRGTKTLSKEEVQELISQADVDGDGKLNCDEFLSLVLSALKEDTYIPESVD